MSKTGLLPGWIARPTTVDATVRVLPEGVRVIDNEFEPDYESMMNWAAPYRFWNRPGEDVYDGQAKH